MSYHIKILKIFYFSILIFFKSNDSIDPILQVGKDIEEFMIVSSEDLEDRMDVNIWVDRVKSMENVEIKECSYNMEALLGKNY